ncbi:MAG: sterol desaturase family protein [Siphonobacter aquaeclarae]|jgi:beta-carotene 3-hydroxylase|nr:sterol desaturase family protein [Siphonobacter aquaeclarae]
MAWYWNLLIALATFLLMEGVAWSTHKYIMHGWLWSWHEDHHRPHKGFFEKNDYFALVFSAIAILLIIAGANGRPALLWAGVGVTGYGLFYFVFHDVIVHRRIKIRFVARSRYMKRIMRAHYIHHKVHTKEGAQAFGFLYAPKKFEGGKL